MKTRMIFVRNSGRTKALFAYFTAQCHLAKNLQNTANQKLRDINAVPVPPFHSQTRSSNLLRQAERIIFLSLAGV